MLLFNSLVEDVSVMSNCAAKMVTEIKGKIGKFTSLPTANKMPFSFGSPQPIPRMSLLIALNTLLSLL